MLGHKGRGSWLGFMPSRDLRELARPFRPGGHSERSAVLEYDSGRELLKIMCVIKVTYDS